MSFFSTSKDFDALDRRVKRAVRDSLKSVYYARVVKVFYDYAPNASNDTANNLPYPPGTIELEPIKTEFSGNVRYAFPIDESTINLPVLNEVVEIFILSNQPFYRRRNLSANINNAILPGFFPTGPGSKPLPDIGLADYKTGIGGTNSTSNINGGETDFKKEKINRLKLFNGDTVIQSRFGQSLRFSGYNNELGEEHPTIIIRNKETATKEDKKNYHTIIEDINKDGSTIAITSGKYKSKFLPGIIDKSGKSNFILKVWQNNPKYAFESYPKELSGNQIVITSGRLIFSSRSEETIFFSKGWFGIVTDSALSIDAQRGVTIVAHKGNIDFESKEGVINFNAGKSGVMHIGSGNGKELAPAVDGKRLVELLGKLIDEVQNLGAAGLFTPCGPTTGVSPVTIQSLATIRNQLASLLSNTVWIAK